jgi:hypothetical protein
VRPLSKGKHIQPPAAAGGVSTQHEKLRFSFEKFVMNCAHPCEHSELISLIDRLRQLSGITWADVLQSHKHGFGTEKIAQYALKVTLPVTPDVDVLAFRFEGKKPMLGFRDGAMFYVLWLDRDFTAYKH